MHVFSDDVTVTYLLYHNIEELMSPASVDVTGNTSRTINSDVISASVSKHSRSAEKVQGPTRLSRPMSYTLTHKDQDLTDMVPVCAYWKYNAR